MKSLQVIELFAGIGADGKPIVEQLHVRELDDGNFQLVQSPAFAKGLASGDIVKMLPQTREFELVQRSGNLSLRVYSRGDIQSLSDALTAELEKLGGELDRETQRMLVYSIHVSCGFSAIENILNEFVGRDGQSAWMYGNVYDPADGETPLNWWQDLLKPE
ncbi:MAG TPA: DUF4265 domain-containing protein [Cellvibrio sp.]|nr:DUF4265 domain-containing protein [Cellvibrio sp.]